MEENNDDRGIDSGRAHDDSGDHIKFEGEEFQRPQSFQKLPPKSVQWVIKYSGGYIKDEKQANYVLIVFVILGIIISLFFFFAGGSSGLRSPNFDLINQPQPQEGYVPR